MPRLGVTALRWLLLVVNIVALGGVVLLGWNVLMPSADDQLRLNLPDPADFVVPPEAEQVFDQGQLRTMLQRHKRKPPPPPRQPEKPKQPELEIRESGPLESWEIASTTIKDSYRAVQIQESVETTTVTTARPSSRTRSRVPANRRRSTRGASRRPSPTNTQGQRVRYVREGDEFIIDDKTYIAMRITVTPEETFEYKDAASRTFTLTREYPELDGVELDDDGRITSLIGLSDADLGLETGTAPGAPSAVPAGERGSIRSGRSASRTTPNRQRPQTQPSRRPQASSDKEKARELDKAVNEAKKSGKLSPSDQKKLKEASKGLKKSP